MSPVRYAAGRIGLRPAPGGYPTPPFGEDGRVVAVDGAELVVAVGGVEAYPLTTLRASAEFVGVEPDAPAGAHKPSTPLEHPPTKRLCRLTGLEVASIGPGWSGCTGYTQTGTGSAMIME